MKKIILFAALAGLCSLAASCAKENVGSDLAEFQVSSSYISVPNKKGGEQSITLNATVDWQIDTTGTRSWLRVSPVQGAAGQFVVKFAAVDSVTATKSAIIYLYNADKTKKQYLNVTQAAGKTEVKPSTCAEIIAGPDGKEYQVEGIVSKITDASKYGNWYITDETGTVYVYGTKDATGATASGALLTYGIEVGDRVTITGPKKTYNGTVELVDVTVDKIVKSLLQVVSESSLEAEARRDTVSVKLIRKGDNLDFKPSVDWLSILSTETLPGAKGAADTTQVNILVAANEAAGRTGEVLFSTSKDGQTSSQTITVNQRSGFSAYPLPYSEDFSKGFNDFTVNVITPRPDGKDIWAATSYSGVFFLKASGGSKVDTKSMVISPKISLASAKSPVLSFKHAGKYCGDQAEELTVWVSADEGATWVQYLIPNEHDNKFGWIESGDISLAAFAGKDFVNIAFQYISNTSYYGTWEITDVKVEDRAPVINTIATLNSVAASSTEVTYVCNLNNAVVTYINGGNAFIQDKSAGIQLYLKNHTFKAGDVISGEVTAKVKLYAGYTEATGFDVSKATVTSGTAPEPQVLTLDKLLKDYLRYQNYYVKLENVTFTSKLAGGSAGRDGKISQGETEIAVRAQVKTLNEMSGTGNLVCLPTRYNANLQLGVWEDAQWTPAQ